jgi:hypothetical protein
MVLPGSCFADSSAMSTPAIATAFCSATREPSASSVPDAHNRPKIPFQDKINAWANENGRSGDKNS